MSPCAPRVAGYGLDPSVNLLDAPQLEVSIHSYHRPLLSLGKRAPACDFNPLPTQLLLQLVQPCCVPDFKR
eukprot:CAMPEP_0181206856 /NCGR_PEP_ID=MMETSP1096-20121128/21262_1 /TAXON_ID=156174 ORGANISM="Chrysochromulina ericina, Strain CCMP281" /NCGR_SAMPLE_ID=MMETSP1096 /ASSEMBLY_ACC=CAM_ASM_000453 /LENGTH=70 /DNA_ID=CAMNT_0023297791 /DNA_START=385 /DNA_END=597 /DNA_ORIENTATION=-